MAQALATPGSARYGFEVTVQRAAGLALDAGCSARAARGLPLPRPTRRRLDAAIVALECAQLNLAQAFDTPWPP